MASGIKGHLQLHLALPLSQQEIVSLPLMLSMLALLTLCGILTHSYPYQPKLLLVK